MYALFFSDTLDYLEMWDRLGPAQTMLGTMLGVKPIATMEDGDLIPVEKVRSYGRAVDKLYEFVSEFSRINQLHLIQHDFETEAAQLSGTPGDDLSESGISGHRVSALVWPRISGLRQWASSSTKERVDDRKQRLHAPQQDPGA